MVNRFISKNSLCDPTDPDCLSRQLSCPSNCSDHGFCPPFSTVCTCFGDYKGNDCSIGSFKSTLNSNSNYYTGTIFGKNANIYQYTFFPIDTSMNLELSLSTLYPTGTIFVFIKIDLEKNSNPFTIRDNLKSQMQLNSYGSIANQLFGFYFF
jgi:hypothetical protein